jgi:hypothetical protein
MKQWQILLIALLLVIAILFNGGIYSIVKFDATEDGVGVYKVNRFTGRVWRIDGTTQYPVQND